MDNQGLPSSHGKLARLLFDQAFRSRVIRYSLGLPTPLDTEDRHVLENIIFKHYLALPDVRTILFVGVDWYTKHYEKTYFENKRLWTIDVSPSARKYGARNHLVCALEDAEEYFSKASFDLIICNGVYGFGLNTKAACERGFGACYNLLRERGYFVLGWNDIPQQQRAPLETIDNFAKFTPCEFPPLRTHRYLTSTPLHHIYEFYEKRE